MKTALFILFSTMLCSLLHAQINKGQWMVGGNGTFSYTNSRFINNSSVSQTKSTSLQFLPDAGYFVVNRLSAGLRSGISYTNMDAMGSVVSSNAGYSVSSKSRITTFVLSPFLRYYFLPNTHKLNLLADISYSYNYNNQHQEITTADYMTNPQVPNLVKSESKTTGHSNGFTLAFGPALFLNPKVSLELTAGYTHARYTDNGSSSNGLVIGTGFHYHFGK